MFDWEEISQDGGRGRAVTAFADPDQDPREKQNAERRGESGGATGDAPKSHRAPDNDPAREAIGQPAEKRSADHIGDEKRVRQQTGAGHGGRVVRREKSPPDFRFDCSQNLTIDVVKKIDPEQQGECGVGSALGFFVHVICRLQ